MVGGRCQGQRSETKGRNIYTYRFEEPRGKPRGIFDRKEFCLILIRSLTPQQAAENALAIAVHGVNRIYRTFRSCNWGFDSRISSNIRGGSFPAGKFDARLFSCVNPISLPIE